jgi:hypothetical protein
MLSPKQSVAEDPESSSERDDTQLKRPYPAASMGISSDQDASKSPRFPSKVLFSKARIITVF